MGWDQHGDLRPYENGTRIRIQTENRCIQDRARARLDALRRNVVTTDIETKAASPGSGMAFIREIGDRLRVLRFSITIGRLRIELTAGSRTL